MEAVRHSTVVVAPPKDQDLKPPVNIDVMLLLVTALLVLFGMVMLYSTTGIVSQEKLGDAFYYVKRQAVAAVVGVGFMLVLSRVKLESLKRLSPYFYFVALFLLMLTLIPGIGDAAGGARRWIKLPFLRFQPGELVKLLFVIFLAGFFSRHQEKMSSFVTGVVKPLCLAGSVCVLLLLQPDFGSSAVIMSVAFIMAAASGARYLHLLTAGLGALVPAVLLVIFSPYRLGRILTFMSPTADMSGKGYQLIQSLIAVGTGSWTGVGIGESRQKLFFLPAAHTDFIFAVIAEELGFVGCLLVLALFLLLLWRGLVIAQKVADNSFNYALAIGLVSFIVVPALLNMGVVTGLLPTKGMVLPLLGYGGSSLVTSLAALGILISIGRPKGQSERNRPRRES